MIAYSDSSSNSASLQLIPGSTLTALGTSSTGLSITSLTPIMALVGYHL